MRLIVVMTGSVVVLVLGFQLWISRSNPPGFHHDEVAFALNAYTIGHTLRGQDNALLPVLLPSYGDYKSTFFVYVLAPIFLVTGPSTVVARGLGTFFGLLAIALVGLVVQRRLGRPVLTLAAVALAGLTPWLFQLGRLAYDTATFPFATVLVLATTEWWSRGGGRFALRCGAVGLALGIMTYSYAAGRLLAPLLALALLLFVGSVPFQKIAGAWIAYAITLIPFAVYEVRHPNGLSARYHQTTFVQPGMSKFDIVRHAIENWAQDLNPVHWFLGGGDPKPYADVRGGQLFAVMIMLAILGIVRAITIFNRDRWWTFVLCIALLSAVPASITPDRHDVLRLSALPIALTLLAVLGIEWALSWRARRAVLAGLAVGAATLLGQWIHFVDTYAANGPNRVEAFDAGVPALLERAFAGGRTVYMDYDDKYAQTDARWYTVMHRLPASRASILPDGGIPPVGAMVFGRTQPCDYVCVRLAEADSYWIARAKGPKRS